MNFVKKIQCVEVYDTKTEKTDAWSTGRKIVGNPLLGDLNLDFTWKDLIWIEYWQI